MRTEDGALAPTSRLPMLSLSPFGLVDCEPAPVNGARQDPELTPVTQHSSKRCLPPTSQICMPGNMTRTHIENLKTLLLCKSPDSGFALNHEPVRQ